jgi:hypothetical protein
MIVDSRRQAKKVRRPLGDGRGAANVLLLTRVVSYGHRMALRRLKYEEPREWTRDEVERALRDDNPDALLMAVIAVSMNESDWKYAQDLCVKLASHPHFNVRGNAVLGFGHIARIHGKLDRPIVQPLIVAALQDESDYVRGQADSAVDDTKIYLGWHYR